MTEKNDIKILMEAKEELLPSLRRLAFEYESDNSFQFDTDIIGNFLTLEIMVTFAISPKGTQDWLRSPKSAVLTIEEIKKGNFKETFLSRFRELADKFRERAYSFSKGL